MEETTILLMEKHKETGYLEKEVDSYTIEENGELIDGIYLIKEDGEDIIHLKLTTNRDVEDDEFESIYDNYNLEDFKDIVLSIEEVDDTYNPTWEVTFKFEDNREAFQNKLQMIINKHKEILDKAMLNCN